MRITSFEKYDMSQFRLSEIQQQANKLQIQMTTGKQYQQISENPVKANASLLVGAGIKKVEQFQSNLSDLTSYLKTAESYMGSVENSFQRASELGLQAANGTYNADDKASFVLEIENIIEHIVGIGNSKYLGNYLFSGQKTDVKPLEYNGTTVTYEGSPNVNYIRVSNNLEIETSVTAEEALIGTIEGLITLRDAIGTGTPVDIGTALENFQATGDNILNARSKLGVRLTTSELVTESYDKNMVELKTRKSEAEDVDSAKVIMDIMNAQMLYQGAVQSTIKMYENSLLNYM